MQADGAGFAVFKVLFGLLFVIGGFYPLHVFWAVGATHHEWFFMVYVVSAAWAFDVSCGWTWVVAPEMLGLCFVPGQRKGGACAEAGPCQKSGDAFHDLRFLTWFIAAGDCGGTSVVPPQDGQAI